MNITIDAATASVLTGLIVGTVSIITTLIANRFSFNQQKTQWEREERRIQRAEIQAEKDKEATHRKEITNQLNEIYGNSIASLTASLLLFTDAAWRTQPEYVTNFKEAQKWLSQIVATHYDKTSKEYKSFLRYYENILEADKNNRIMETLREKVIEFISKDPRLQT
jgi:Zn-dependent M32 family carboxypeptidase